MPPPSEPPSTGEEQQPQRELGELTDELPKAVPLPLAIELPGQKAVAKPQHGERDGRYGAAPDPGRTLRWVVRAGAVLLALGAMAAAAAIWILPWYVRRECIAEAAAHGITLAVDDAALDAHGFRLLGVHATVAGLPGRADAPEVDVTTSGLRPLALRVHRAELTLSGRWSTVDAALSSWRSSATGGQQGAWTPESIAIEESRIVWQGPFAEDARVEASNVHFDIAWSGTTPQLRGRSDNVTVAVPDGKLGPWAVDAERTSSASRLRVALDPGVPDACTVLVVQDAAGATSVDVVVPRSPLARLGLPPALLGLQGKALQVALTAHYVPMGPERADLTAKGGLYGIEAGLPAPLDVAWDVVATGAPSAGLDVEKSRLAAGPLVGALAGTVKPFDDGFRVDLAWSAGPVPCAAFDAPLGEGSPFDIAYQLRKLASNVAAVKGDVTARGSLAFDSRDLATTRVEFTPEAKCQVALFGQ